MCAVLENQICTARTDINQSDVLKQPQHYYLEMEPCDWLMYVRTVRIWIHPTVLTCDVC